MSRRVAPADGLTERQAYPSPVAAGVWTGLGLGGFLDGIVLHQLLQWHHLISNVQPPTTLDALRANVVWDGAFHVVTWTLTAVGAAMLWRTRGRAPGRVVAGAVLLGWGLFTLFDGAVNHHLLGIHHVRAGPDQLAWDLAWLAFGAALAAGGWLLMRARAAPV